MRVFKTYCGWKKSCATWDGRTPITNRFQQLQDFAGPSTVLRISITWWLRSSDHPPRPKLTRCAARRTCVRQVRGIVPGAGATNSGKNAWINRKNIWIDNEQSWRTMTISWLTYWTWTILKEWTNNNLQVVHMCDNSISHHLPVRSKKEISRRQPQVDPAGCYFWEISTLLWLEIPWKTSPVENGGLSAPAIYGVSTVQAGAKFRIHPQCGPGKQWLWAMQTEDVRCWWFQPLWKIWKSVGMTIPNLWKVIKFMFQTTKQFLVFQCHEDRLAAPQPLIANSHERRVATQMHRGGE